MRDIIRKHHVSFKAAWAGIVWSLRTQPNFRIHFFFSIIAIVLGCYFHITKTEAIIIAFTILLGLAGEMINTSLEAVTDLVTTEWKQNAKIAKDVAAGMMLTIAIGAIIIGGIIFLPYIFALLQ